MNTGIDERLAEVRGRMAEAARKAGRQPEETELVAVTKTHAPEAMQEALRRGRFCSGKIGCRKLAEDAAGIVAGTVALHRAPSEEQGAAGAAGVRDASQHRFAGAGAGRPADRGGGRQRPRVLLEVNVAGEASKFGFKPATLEAEWKR